MSKQGIHVHTDKGLQGMIDDLHDLSDSLASEATRARLDAVTADYCEALRSSMPVRTGALKASGQWSSEHSADHYEGTVEFGGAAAPYAPYVVGRGVNGNHPWDDLQPFYEKEFGAAINSIWDNAME